MAARLGAGQLDSEAGVPPGADEAAREVAYKRYGMSRAARYGWQDTYVYTKALGEMLLGQVARDAGLPVAIVRPSIVESAWREPMR